MKSFFLISFLFLFISGILAQKLYPVQIKGKWGYMDAAGKMQIPAKYDYVEIFNEGYAVVALNYLPCLIDINETRVIDTGLYQYVGKYSEGLASVMDYKFRRFYLNKKGEKVISLEKEIYDARQFNNGIARVG